MPSLQDTPIQTPPATQRRTARQIFEQVEDNAHEELRRSTQALAFSGLAGGMTMGLTGLGVAAAMSMLPDIPSRLFIAYMFYPVGFIAVIIGRAQLFTENTLYPVALILSERRHVLDTLRLWAVVFTFNILGAVAFAALAIRTDALNDAVARNLVWLGTTALQFSNSHIFWSGVIGGWMIALVAWVVTASHWTIGQIAVIWFLTMIVGLGRFAHCIATSGEIMAAVMAGSAPFTHYLVWLALATAGNICGGVMIVTLLNFGQVKAGEA